MIGDFFLVGNVYDSCCTYRQATYVWTDYAVLERSLSRFRYPWATSRTSFHRLSNYSNRKYEKVNASCLIVGDVLKIGDCPKKLFSERPEITTKSPDVRLVRFSRTGPMVPHFSPKSDGRQSFEETMTDANCPRNRLHLSPIPCEYKLAGPPAADEDTIEVWKWSTSTFLGRWHKLNDSWVFL